MVLECFGSIFQSLKITSLFCSRSYEGAVENMPRSSMPTREVGGNPLAVHIKGFRRAAPRPINARQPGDHRFPEVVHSFDPIQ